MIVFGIILIVMVFVIFVKATEKVKYGEFDNPSWLLVTFGVYQWGQALVLSAFWMLFGVACISWWSPNQALRVYILFHLIRALIELFLLIGGQYQGLAYAIAPQSHQLTSEQRVQLYSLGQGLIMLSSIIYLYVT